MDSLIGEVITSLLKNFPSCHLIVLLINVGRTRCRVAKAEGRAEESGGRVDQSDGKVVRLRKQMKKLENNYDLQIAYKQEMLDQEDRECSRSLTPEEFGEISGELFLGLLESE